MTTKTDRRTLLQIVAAGVILFLMIVLLRAQGRLWLCACGQFEIWTSDTCSSNNSQQLFDPYSLTHVVHGFLFLYLVVLVFRRLAPGWQLLLALALEAAWEVFENSSFVIERYRTATAALGYQGDTVVNSIGDLACALIGFLIARQIGIRGSLILFALLELILILWIHDSFLLQILMLVWPIEAIKAWQMCA
ncbi:MAG TPA: DUF2585 family protein [Pyrinomonadaceae bacterium]|nr:DUF2585 family protein [Pyrinomonadaceae bacterium]